MILVSYNISTNSFFFTVFSNKKRLTLAYLSDHLFTPAYKNCSRLIRLEWVIIKAPGQFSTSNIHPFSTMLSLVQPSSSPLSTQQYSGLHSDAFTRNHPHSCQNTAALPLWCSKWAVTQWLLSNQTARLEQSVLLMYVSCYLVCRSQREHFNQCKKNYIFASLLLLILSHSTYEIFCTWLKIDLLSKKKKCLTVFSKTAK